MSDIFISYASEDRARAEMLAAALEARGWSVWWDRTIPPGKTFDEVIEEALDASSCVIVVWSQTAVASQWVRAEAGEGLKRGILIPVLIEDVQLPLAFRQIHAAGLIDWRGEPAHPGFGQLVGAVSDLLGEPPPVEPEPTAKGGRQEAAPRAAGEKAKGKAEQEEQRNAVEEAGQEAEREDEPTPDKEKMSKAEPDETRKAEEKDPKEIEAESAKRRRLWIAAAAVVLAVAGFWGVYQYYQYDVRVAEIRTLEEMRRVAMEEERRQAAEEERRKAEEEEIRRAEETAQREAAEDARRRAEEEAMRQAEEEARREQDAEAQRERVHEAQTLLAELGYAPGPADGKEGPATERAIARFKRKAELPSGSVVDEALLVALRDAARARNEETPGRRTEGETFRDCPECPEMVVVPAGRFMMGSPGTERGRDDIEGPQHRVTISRPFAVGKYEVTFAEWDACVSGGGCKEYRPPERFAPRYIPSRDRMPVWEVSWYDAQAYVEWISDRTSNPYRLLTEAEWEFVARAGTSTRYWWGEEAGFRNANCKKCWERELDDWGPTPVGWFRPNPFGLYDTAGNVMEWVQDCYNRSYLRAPTDGTAWTAGECELRVVRGGSWGFSPVNVRSAHRYVERAHAAEAGRSGHVGFRVARTLP